MGKLFYIMGKSASGKDTIYSKLLANAELDLKRLVIYSTRPIRDGEKNGQEYFFVDEDTFQRMRLEGKIIEDREYYTVYGLWRYFTAANMQLDQYNYLGIGTLESFVQLKKYYGEDSVCPLYIEVEDGERLKRAIAREETQDIPKYEEMCRRFLADCKDFTEEKIEEAGIVYRFQNIESNRTLQEIESYLKTMI